MWETRIDHLGAPTSMQARIDTHPRYLKNRLEPAARAGFEAWRAPRGTSAVKLLLVAPHLLWVNPTVAALLRPRRSSPPSCTLRVRERAPVTKGSAALHEAHQSDTRSRSPAA